MIRMPYPGGTVRRILQWFRRGTGPARYGHMNKITQSQALSLAGWSNYHRTPVAGTYLPPVSRYAAWEKITRQTLRAAGW